AAAGALATILTHPPDVVRTHLQLASLRATPGKPLTMLGATSAIYKVDVARSSWFLPRGGAACAEAINAAGTHSPSHPSPLTAPFPPSVFSFPSVSPSRRVFLVFFRGVVPRVLKRSMQQALTWTLFERLSSVLSGRTLWDRKDAGPARRTGV
ncbi:unnamed protein product, partial [Closterium sp. Naga37s-1]